MNFSSDDDTTTELGYTTMIYEVTSEIINKTVALGNHSGDVDDKVPANKAQFLLYDLLIPILGSIIMLMNLAVVVSSGLILKRGQQPKSTYLFLGNVAMTDLITGIALVFGQTFPRSHRDHYICSLQIGMIVSSTIASVYSVGLIAIDRFLYILHGMQYQKWVYPNRARLMIAITWLIGCVIGFMPIFGWYSNTENGKICWFIRLAPKELIVLTVVLGIIPLMVVLFLYSIILYNAIRKITQLKNLDNHNDISNDNQPRMFRGRPQLQAPPAGEKPAEESTNQNWFTKIFKKKQSSTVSSPKKWKAIKVVLFTTSSFVITWSPYFIVSLVYVYTCDDSNRDTKRCKNISLLIASPLAILGFINSLMNPIIYAWWHKGFRTYVKKRVSTIIMRTRGRTAASQSITKSTSRKTSSTTTPATISNNQNCSNEQPNT